MGCQHGKRNNAGAVGCMKNRIVPSPKIATRNAKINRHQSVHRKIRGFSARIYIIGRNIIFESLKAPNLPIDSMFSFPQGSGPSRTFELMREPMPSLVSPKRRHVTLAFTRGQIAMPKSQPNMAEKNAPTQR